MKNLTKALLQVQSEMGAISKDSKNPFFKSTYLSLNGLREAVIPTLTKYGVVVLQPTVFREGRNFIATQLIHAESGELVEGLTEVVVKQAGNAQDLGSGMSYARRYGLMSILCLAAEDDDGNTAAGKQMPERHAVAPKEAVKSAEAPPAKKISFNKKAAVNDGDI